MTIIVNKKVWLAYHHPSISHIEMAGSPLGSQGLSEAFGGYLGDPLINSKIPFNCLVTQFHLKYNVFITFLLAVALHISTDKTFFSFMVRGGISFIFQPLGDRHEQTKNEQRRKVVFSFIIILMINMYDPGCYIGNSGCQQSAQMFPCPFVALNLHLTRVRRFGGGGRLLAWILRY